MCQWVQQTLPVTGSVYSIVFFDQNTGLVSINSTPAYLLRTTNGGNNWSVISNYKMHVMNKIDSVTMYGIGVIGIECRIYRTINRGLTFDSVGLSSTIGYQGLHFFNRDTGLISGFDGSNYLIYKTTNAGVTLTPLSYQTGAGTLFFLKEKVNGEYYGWNYPNFAHLYSTTNSGLNWLMHTELSPEVSGVFFLNKDTGWVSNASGSNCYINYTSNGGLNWTVQNIPYSDASYEPFFVNSRKGWVGWSRSNKILATTNGGQNWGWQYTPTFSTKIFFLDSLNAWCGGYSAINHTTNGGGTINKIANSNEQIANEYKLYQNYPNPFNSSTVINYSLLKNSYISIKIYDILGKEIATLINTTQKQGLHNIQLNMNNYNLSSGIYLYTIAINELSSSFTYRETKLMSYIK
jgi:photosystem II stability/assembly factor-like uncharacterized protein